MSLTSFHTDTPNVTVSTQTRQDEASGPVESRGWMLRAPGVGRRCARPCVTGFADPRPEIVITACPDRLAAGVAQQLPHFVGRGGVRRAGAGGSSGWGRPATSAPSHPSREERSDTAPGRDPPGRRTSAPPQQQIIPSGLGAGGGGDEVDLSQASAAYGSTKSGRAQPREVRRRQPRHDGPCLGFVSPGT